MKLKVCGILLIIGALGTRVDAAPVVGQSVIYRYDSSHSYAATVTRIEGDGTADLVIYSWVVSAFSFGQSSLYAAPVTVLDGVTEGSGDNRWSVNPNIGLGATGTTGATGAQGPTGSTGTTGATGPGSLVTGVSTPSLSLNGAAAQFDATHDSIYTVNIKITTTLSVAGGAAGHVDLLCDATTTPAVVVGSAQSESTGTLTVGLNLQSSNTLALQWRVPAAHRCRLTSTNDVGTPTYSVVRQFLQPLG